MGEQDLLDELTHPRLRMRKEQRFYHALKKIHRSDLFTDAERDYLLDQYIATMKEQE